MLLQVIGFLLVGRLVVFVLQKFPFIKIPFIGRLFEEGKFLEQLFGCSLCLGCYLYAILAYFTGVDILSEFGFHYVPILSEVLTGIAASFLMYIIAIGWNTRFGILEVR